jgi:Gas vesicle synthesis protein GvpL/GvpF
MRGTATYVYCLAERSRSPSLTSVPTGLPQATRPELIDIKKGLWGVVSDVPLSVYGAERLEPRLKDLNWVADIALAHEAVVEHVASRAGTSVVPMKLFTMFSSPDRASADLAARWADIKAALDRIRGCNEWGIRVMKQPTQPTRTRSAAVRGASSGTAFLAAKKRARDDARVGLEKAADAAEDAFESLAKLAREARRREPPETATSPPLVDAAFLVSDSRKERFRAAARRLAKSCRQAGADLILTGPWPAYNFVQQASEDGR